MGLSFNCCQIGYTYDTTDLTALYHRLVILNVDQIIYITDLGQKSHFDMCFEIATKMGWVKEKLLKHIGFGLVCGPDGKKLKSRSGKIVKMLDVIDEVIEKSRTFINERIESKDDDYYKNLTETDIKDMSRKIGINTLKYFDLSHNYNSNYKYNHKLMFQSNGDTGVYLMYCYARINGICEKSTLKLNSPEEVKNLFEEEFKNIQENITKDTRGLLLHILDLNDILSDAYKTLDIIKVVNYLYDLCKHFNIFSKYKNGKILGSNLESHKLALCLITRKIIQNIFNLLSFELIDHI